MGEEGYGAALPSQPNKRWYRVESPKRDAKMRVTLLSETFVGFWVHWDGAVLPCTRQHTCQYCNAGMGNRWQGYIAAWDLVAHKRIILALSEGAARQLLDMRRAETGLRGVSVEVFRRHPLKNNSSLKVQEMGYQRSEDCFPPHPILDSLNRLFGLNEKFLARGGDKLPPDMTEPDDALPPLNQNKKEPTRPKERGEPAPTRPGVNPTRLAERFRMPDL